jgi:hypothetical protein
MQQVNTNVTPGRCDDLHFSKDRVGPRYVSASSTFLFQEIERLELSEPLEWLELAAINYQLSTKDLTPNGSLNFDLRRVTEA